MVTISWAVVSFLGKERVELTRQCHKRTYWSVQTFLDLVVVYTCVSNCQSPSNRKDVCNSRSLKLCLNQLISGQCLSWAWQSPFPSKHTCSPLDLNLSLTKSQCLGGLPALALTNVGNCQNILGGFALPKWAEKIFLQKSCEPAPFLKLRTLVSQKTGAQMNEAIFS